MNPRSESTAPPTRFAMLSVGAALATIGLKFSAFYITGSVGLLSDAMESLVNLAAAVIALIALWVAAKEPDEEHAYGHAKAEYFSSGLEGMLVLLAAGLIAWSAIPRLFTPQPVDQVGIGLAVAVVASVVNGWVAWRLGKAARDHRSITLEASARHLLTDVWTSGGVVIAVALVAVTGWHRLDPVIALVMAGYIIWTGWNLVDKSVHGLLDTALPDEDLRAIDDILQGYRREIGIETHALRTREAGARRFMSVHVLVPGDWSVRRGHRLLEKIERDLHARLPGITVFTHLEPLDDPASWADMNLDRSDIAEQEKPTQR